MYVKKKFTFYLRKSIENAIEIYNESQNSTTRYNPKFVFNSKDETLFIKIKQNTIKSQIYIKNKCNPIINNRLGLICEKFKISGKNMKKPTFGGKGRYRIPIRIIKCHNNNYYVIQFPFKYKNLEPNVDYYAEYNLLKLCDDKTWNELLEIYNK